MKRGFTLIELLVVVLIIGILAAVALPLYQKAVWKTRLANAVTFANNAEKTLGLYVLEHGWPETAVDAIGNPDMLLQLCPTETCQDSAFRDDYFQYTASIEETYYGWYFSFIRPEQYGYFYAACDTYTDGHQECYCSDEDTSEGKIICAHIRQMLPRNWN